MNVLPYGQMPDGGVSINLDASAMSDIADRQKRDPSLAEAVPGNDPYDL